jgi:hypothetical protein
MKFSRPFFVWATESKMIPLAHPKIRNFQADQSATGFPLEFAPHPLTLSLKQNQSDIQTSEFVICPFLESIQDFFIYTQ